MGAYFFALPIGPNRASALLKFLTAHLLRSILTPGAEQVDVDSNLHTSKLSVLPERANLGSVFCGRIVRRTHSMLCSQYSTPRSQSEDLGFTSLQLRFTCLCAGGGHQLWSSSSGHMRRIVLTPTNAPPRQE